MLWWLNLDIRECHMSLKSIPVWESHRMATDAMDTAIGSVFRGEVMYKVLDSNVAKQTIAHKEWLAFSKTFSCDCICHMFSVKLKNMMDLLNPCSFIYPSSSNIK